METEQKPHDLDVFEMTRGEVNVLLNILGKLPFDQVSGVMNALSNRPPARLITEEQLAAINAEIAKRAEEASLVLSQKEVNVEAAAESSGPSEEEKTTEQ